MQANQFENKIVFLPEKYENTQIFMVRKGPGKIGYYRNRYFLTSVARYFSERFIAPTVSI